jgi:hypothetical protein
MEDASVFWLAVLALLFWSALGLWAVFRDLPKWAYALWLIGMFLLLMLCVQSCPLDLTLWE